MRELKIFNIYVAACSIPGGRQRAVATLTAADVPMTLAPTPAFKQANREIRAGRIAAQQQQHQAHQKLEEAGSQQAEAGEEAEAQAGEADGAAASDGIRQVYPGRDGEVQWTSWMGRYGI